MLNLNPNINSYICMYLLLYLLNEKGRWAGPSKDDSSSYWCFHVLGVWPQVYLLKENSGF